MMPPLFDGSRLFHVPPGLAFPEAFARGLAARLRGRPPLDAARIEVLVPSARAATLVDRALAAHLGPDALLPAVRVVGALADHPAAPVLPPAVSPLRRMLRLSELVRAFLDRRPEIAPPSARFALAEALAALLDELQAAGLGPDALDRIDVAQHARHWQTTRDFVGIIADHWPAILAEEEGGALDPEAREARALEGIAARWSARPPDHPVILAGSTGSRPLTARLMALVAGLPQGALVLPGFDSWLDPALHPRLGPDHPQAAMAALLGRIGADPAAVAPWDAAAPCPERNRLISLALQPAPVTDRWLDAAPALAEILPAATAGLALVEAPGRRQEALAVALMMRETLERPGATVALITPDRQLARAVTAALARWDLVPDDSAGRPLGQTPPGIFLRLVARLAGGPPAAGALIELAKHPLCGGEGAARREHMRRTASLELFLRRNAIPLADPGAIRRWAAGRPAQAGAWAAWICDAIAPLARPGALEVSAAAARLRGVAEALAAGPGGDPGRLWRREDGAAALELVSELAQAAGTGAMLEPAELARLLDELMAARNVPPADPARPPDPRLRILGNREARLESADRVILGGLTEGVWPALPGADPWLSRPMRRELGLAAPERGIGLAAHDFATAIGAPEVIVTRAARIDGAPALPSRWLVRLENLLLGCGEAGAQALEGMRARGREWLRLAARLDRPAAPVAPAPRPAPRPPLALRPRRLPVTRIEELIRDPYAIYAERVLGLSPLDPLDRPPDARDRGIVLHSVLRRFIAETVGQMPGDARARLMRIAEEELARMVPWPAERRLWRARLERAADWLIAGEAERLQAGRPVALEVRGAITLDLPAGPFTLTAIADRIDRLDSGGLAIIDYKTGKPPQPKRIRAFARQLPLEAVIAEAGGFTDVPAAQVERLLLVGVTGTGEGGETRCLGRGAEADFDPPVERDRLVALLARYDDPAFPYTARLRPQFIHGTGPYDHLARLGEWEGGEAEEDGG